MKAETVDLEDLDMIKDYVERTEARLETGLSVQEFAKLHRALLKSSPPTDGPDRWFTATP